MLAVDVEALAACRDHRHAGRSAQHPVDETGRGVDEMLLSVQTGRTRHEHVCEALELFAAEVMPEFAARRPAREAAKRGELGEPHAVGEVANRLRRPAARRLPTPPTPVMVTSRCPRRLCAHAIRRRGR